MDVKKDDIKKKRYTGYIFNYVDFEIIKIKDYAKTDIMKLGQDNIKCIFGYASNVVKLYLMIIKFF